MYSNYSPLYRVIFLHNDVVVDKIVTDVMVHKKFTEKHIVRGMKGTKTNEVHTIKLNVPCNCSEEILYLINNWFCTFSCLNAIQSG